MSRRLESSSDRPRDRDRYETGSERPRDRDRHDTSMERPRDRDPKDKLEDFSVGPLSVLHEAVESKTQILINCRNNKKLLARVKAFDRHYNMLLVDAKEMWEENKYNESGEKIDTTKKDRFISKMFLRGDGVILILKNPFEYEENPTITVE